jgi:hypothetical protein
MTQTNNKINALLAKHPNLSKDEAIKIFADKNERKKKKRAEKVERNNIKILTNKESRSENQAD